MKAILAAVIAVPLIGLAIVGAVIFPLLIMILPLVALALASGWGLVHTGPSAAERRERDAAPPRGRHVVDAGRTR